MMISLLVNGCQKIVNLRQNRRWTKVTKWKANDSFKVYRGLAVDSKETNLYNNLSKMIQRLDITEER